jgi:hypothetical protein
MMRELPASWTSVDRSALPEPHFPVTSLDFAADHALLTRKKETDDELISST